LLARPPRDLAAFDAGVKRTMRLRIALARNAESGPSQTWRARDLFEPLADEDPADGFAEAMAAVTGAKLAQWNLATWEEEQKEWQRTEAVDAATRAAARTRPTAGCSHPRS